MPPRAQTSRQTRCGAQVPPREVQKGQELLQLPAAPGLQAKLAGPAAENRRQKEQKKKKDVPRTHHQLVVCVGGGARSGARHAATKGGVPKRRSQASIAGQPTQPWCRVSASSPPSRQRTAVTRRGTQTHGAQALEKLAAPTSLGGAGHPAGPTPHEFDFSRGNSFDGNSFDSCDRRCMRACVHAPCVVCCDMIFDRLIRAGTRKRVCMGHHDGTAPPLAKCLA